MLGNVYMTVPQIIEQYKLKVVDVKGDITFYEDSKEKQYQQIGTGEIFKVKDGTMAFKLIKNVNGLTIKYNVNGCDGFSIWNGKVNLEDRIWKLSEAEAFAREMN